MKVYVDELPKSCIGCPCESEYYCNLLNEDVGCCPWREIHKNCPLQSISDYTKQVRKEVCEEIGRKITMIAKKQPNHNIGFDCEDIQISYLEVAGILDQIQGE